MPKTLKHEICSVALLLAISGLTGADLIADYLEESDFGHLVLELIVCLLSVFGTGFLVREVIRRKQALNNLNVELIQSKEKLRKMSQSTEVPAHQFMKVVHKQFSDWSLTLSETEVAMLLLKGLSFEEIANVRQTKEKTVRQQASAIYRKSSLSGRHEFSAWFLEDLMQ